MNERGILFFLEIARSSASASISDFASGRFRSRSSRMFRGTAASTRESRFSKPTSRSMTRTSFSFGPIWRRAKEFGSIVSSRRCMGADYGKRIALQVCRRRPALSRLPSIERREFRRRGFSIGRAARPSVDGCGFRPCKERSLQRHPGWRRRDRAGFASHLLR